MFNNGQFKKTLLLINTLKPVHSNYFQFPCQLINNSFTPRKLPINQFSIILGLTM